MGNKYLNTYNEINKDYDVEVVTVEELKQIAKTKPNTKVLICTEKTKTSKQPKVTLAMFYNEFKQFKDYVLDVFKRNNLK